MDDMSGLIFGIINPDIFANSPIKSVALHTLLRDRDEKY
jgi:hypothetical protein